jgi:hypothetical protein
MALKLRRDAVLPQTDGLHRRRRRQLQALVRRRHILHLKVHDSEFCHVAFQGFRDGHVGRVIQILRQGRMIGQCHNNTMCEPTCSIGKIGAAPEILNYWNSPDQSATRSEMLLDATRVDARVKAEPSDVQKRHECSSS